MAASAAAPTPGGVEAGCRRHFSKTACERIYGSEIDGGRRRAKALLGGRREAARSNLLVAPGAGKVRLA